LHGKHGGGCDQKISFYFGFIVSYFSIQPHWNDLPVKNGTKKRKVDPPFTRAL
jgi:hypothetical protein